MLFCRRSAHPSKPRPRAPRCAGETAICLLVFAVDSNRDYPLIVAGNRDEFYARPASPAGFWKDYPHILAGRDLEKGGTWLGVTTSGRFAALTNYRDPRSRKLNPKSRGHLVAGFLAGSASPENYLSQVAEQSDDYDAFNLIVAEPGICASLSSRDRTTRVLAPGIYGLSNHVLDTPWPKVVRAKAAFAELVSRPEASALLDLLADRTAAADSHLPETGVSLDLERTLSPIFIVSPGYGTRASTAVLFHRNGDIDFYERSFANEGAPIGEREYRINRDTRARS